MPQAVRTELPEQGAEMGDLWWPGERWTRRPLHYRQVWMFDLRSRQAGLLPANVKPASPRLLALASGSYSGFTLGQAVGGHSASLPLLLQCCEQ